MTYFSGDDLQNFTHFPSLIFAKLDESYTVHAINAEVTNVLGWSPEDILGRSITAFFKTDDVKFFSFLPTVQQSRFRHKAGHWVWLTWIARKIDGNYYLIGREYTQEQERDEAVRQATQRLALAVKISEVGIFEWNPQTNAIRYDDIIGKIYGYAPGTMPQTVEPVNRQNHPEDVPHILEGVEKAVRERSLFSNEHRLFRTDGELRYVKCWIQPFEGADGSIRVIGTMQDVTEEKLLLQISEILTTSFDYLKNIEAVLRIIVDHFGDAANIDHIDEEKGTFDRIIAQRDPVTRQVNIITKSFAYEAIAPEHPLLTDLMKGEVITIEDSVVFWQALLPFFSDKFIQDIRVDNVKRRLLTLLKRGEKILGVMALALHRENPRAFSDTDKKFFKEVSVLVSMAVENSLLYYRSQEAVRTRDEFLAVASHELKTPLQTLTLQNDMLTRQLAKTPERMNPDLILKFLENDRRQLKRISRLVEEMLDITRIQSAQLRIEKERFDFVGLLRDIVDQMRPTFAENKMDVSLRTDPSLLIEADSFRIEQVITNLLTNALKFGEHRPVEITATREGKRLRFSVKDHGVGLSKEDQKRIFLRFSRSLSRLQTSGLGLGLYICQKVVQAHGGDIHIESELNQGSTFTVFLPLLE